MMTLSNCWKAEGARDQKISGTYKSPPDERWALKSESQESSIFSA